MKARAGRMLRAIALSCALLSSCGGRALLSSPDGSGSGGSAAIATAGGIARGGAGPTVGEGGAMSTRGGAAAASSGASGGAGDSAGGSAGQGEPLGCILDSDCPNDGQCIAQQCAPPCTANEQCDGFCSEARCHLPAVDIAAGDDATCAVLSDGSVYCWGANERGQLAQPGANAYVPLRTPLQHAKMLGMGHQFGCMVNEVGVVQCWGANDRGQLGNETRADSAAPVAVHQLNSGMSPVTAIASGRAHSCVLLGNGWVRCWGDNAHGQLGDGTHTEPLLPVSVPGFGGAVFAVQLVAGAAHTCALSSEGAVLCWGSNQHGQLGLPDAGDAPSPVVVPSLANAPYPVVSIAAGGDHTCAQLADRSALCWGDDSVGQLGDGMNQPFNSQPSRVWVLSFPALRGITVAADDDHTCAVMSDGSLRCWGNNQFGELGDGSRAPSAWGVKPVGLPDHGATVLEVALNGSHVCALMSDGSVRCWGNNAAGQLGAETTQAYSTAPLRVISW